MSGLRLAGLFALLGSVFAVACIRHQPDMILPYGLSAIVMFLYALRAFCWKEQK